MMTAEKTRRTSLGQLLSALKRIEQEDGQGTTLLGIGPMSENMVRATLELGRDEDFPVVFIASRNQVDTEELGGGYVLGWDQKRFVESVNRIAEEVRFTGALLICRDHGGPWQRDNEKKENLSEQEAMEKAKISYLNDLLAGFSVLHIDPTVAPHTEGYVPLDTVIRLTVELIEYVETERIKRSMPPIGYEIGTEETAGGLTDADAFDQFLGDLKTQLEGHRLPRPDFIVGQTGTLIRMKENVGSFSTDKARELSAIAHKHGVAFKEHNADFLDADILREHPGMGIDGANTGPEFSVAETEGFLHLAQLEDQAAREGRVREPSLFSEIVQEAALKSGRWKKWLPKERQHLTEAEIRSNAEGTAEAVSVAGRYVFDWPEVVEAREKMFSNLIDGGVLQDPGKEVIETIKRSIKVWVDAFNLQGISSKIALKLK